MVTHRLSPLLFFLGKIIQVVSSIVTATAFREFLVNAFCVRQIVTVATGRHSSVLVGVTCYTSDIQVLGFSSHQLIVGGVVTGSTKNILGGIWIFQNKWLVNIMTDSTVILGHGFGVRLVTCGALRNVPVGI